MPRACSVFRAGRATSQSALSPHPRWRMRRARPALRRSRLVTPTPKPRFVRGLAPTRTCYRQAVNSWRAGGNCSSQASDEAAAPRQDEDSIKKVRLPNECQYWSYFVLLVFHTLVSNWLLDLPALVLFHTYTARVFWIRFHILVYTHPVQAENPDKFDDGSYDESSDSEHSTFGIADRAYAWNFMYFPPQVQYFPLGTL